MNTAQFWTLVIVSGGGLGLLFIVSSYFILVGKRERDRGEE